MTATATLARRRHSPRDCATPAADVHNGYNAHGRPVLTPEGRAAAEAIELTYLFDAAFEPIGDGAHICGRPNGPLKAACRSCVYDGLQRVAKHARSMALIAARRASWASRQLPDGLPGRIRKLREELSWTQAELADAAGLATITVRQIETAKRRPSLDTAARLAKALDVPIDALYFPEPPTD